MADDPKPPPKPPRGTPQGENVKIEGQPTMTHTEYAAWKKRYNEWVRSQGIMPKEEEKS